MNGFSVLRCSSWICSLGIFLATTGLRADDSEFVFVGDEDAAPAVQSSDNAVVSDLGVVVADETFVEKRFVAPRQAAPAANLTTILPASAQGELKVTSIPDPFSHAPQSSKPLVGVEKPLPGPTETGPTETRPIRRESATRGPVVSTPPVLPEVDQLLIDAHTLSQSAATVTDYSEVIDKCVAALKAGTYGEKQEFATTLISWALNRRGQIYSNEYKYELATADFQEAVHFDPNNWRALHNRGVSSAEAGQFADAFDDFNRVIELNPKFAKAYTNRGTLYVQAGDLTSAEQDYQMACKLDGKLSSARLGLARAYHMAGRWEEALQNFTIAAKLDSKNPGILCSRGDVLADMGRYGEALADYAVAIEQQRDFAHAYRNGAWLLATCPDADYRDAENAILGAKKALEFEYGERYVALDTLAAAYANNGQFEEAIATLDEAIELAPSALRAEYLSRIELYETGQPFRTQPVTRMAQAGYSAK